MTSVLYPLRIRNALGRDHYGPPRQFGKDGWLYRHRGGDGSIIVTLAPTGFFDNDVDWIHASITREARLPSYSDLVLLHKAVFGAGWAYQVFAPADKHVNIHEYALHLYGRADGLAALPDFGMYGTI